MADIEYVLEVCRPRPLSIILGFLSRPPSQLMQPTSKNLRPAERKKVEERAPIVLSETSEGDPPRKSRRRRARVRMSDSLCQ